jgi:membrane fusion protein (multidrug efflux system)
MNRRTCFTWLLIVSTLVALTGCRRQPENAEVKEETATPVMVYVARPDTISKYLKLTGGIEAENEALVYSKSNEKIEEILVKIGDQVKADQVLLVQSTQLLQQGITQAESAVNSATAQYELAQQDYARVERLYKENISSKQQFDQVQTQLKAAKAGLEQAQSRLKQAKEQYQSSVVKAPIAGKVAMVFFQEGQIAPVGQPVIKITHTSSVKAKLYVPETDLAFISVGQPVIATFPAFPDTEFPGTVDRVDEAVDPQKRALAIEVRIENANPMLKSGQFGQFLIEIQRHADAIVVTDTAVMTETEVKLTDKGKQETFQTSYVFVVENDRASKRVVTPGIYAQGRIELTSGIMVGDNIIVMGQNLVNDGDLVKIVESTE